jgi:hypothetical protein
VILPKDFQPGGAKFYAGPGDIMGAFESEVTNCRKWWERELGMTFDPVFKMIPTSLTHLEMAAGHLDPEGYGMDEGTAWGVLGQHHNLNGPHRTWCVVVGSMHWYGARFNQAENKGGAFWGDDTITLLVKGAWDRAEPPEQGIGHEQMHSFGLVPESGADYSIDKWVEGKASGSAVWKQWTLNHTPGYPDPLLPEWKTLIKQVNSRFLRPL